MPDLRTPFSSAMALANLAGLKDITRRKPSAVWRRAKPGDVIVMAEAFAFARGWDKTRPSEVPRMCEDGATPVWFRADQCTNYYCSGFEHGRVRPPMFMPSWASRFRAPIVSVRFERLDAITEEDAIREGLEAFSLAVVGHPGSWCIPGTRRRPNCGTSDPILAFSQLWDHVHGPGSWERDAGMEVARVEYRNPNKEKSDG